MPSDKVHPSDFQRLPVDAGELLHSNEYLFWKERRNVGAAVVRAEIARAEAERSLRSRQGGPLGRPRRNGILSSTCQSIRGFDSPRDRRTIEPEKRYSPVASSPNQSHDSSRVRRKPEAVRAPGVGGAAEGTAP